MICAGKWQQNSAERSFDALKLCIHTDFHCSAKLAMHTAQNPASNDGHTRHDKHCTDMSGAVFWDVSVVRPSKVVRSNFPNAAGCG